MENLGKKIVEIMCINAHKRGLFATAFLSDNLYYRFACMDDCTIRKENDRIYAELVEKQRCEIEKRASERRKELCRVTSEDLSLNSI